MTSEERGAKEENMENSNEIPWPQFKIKVTRDGPYIMSGGIRLAEQIICVDEEGETHGWRLGLGFPLSQKYALCRCGQSRNPPFCDGTHLNIGFDGMETATKQPYMKQAEKYAGRALDLTDAENLCASARFCHRSGGIWKLVEESDVEDRRRTAIEQAADCPSGRLIVWRKNGETIEPECEPSVWLVQDPQAGVSGPIWVRGGIPIESADRDLYEVRTHVTLCRCGKSKNKPFCDGTHVEAKFSDGSQSVS